MEVRVEALSAIVSTMVLFIPLILALLGSGKSRRAAEERERRRRLTDARMNAVLLRMNI